MGAAAVASEAAAKAHPQLPSPLPVLWAGRWRAVSELAPRRHFALRSRVGMHFSTLHLYR